jgi:hypothetical protein
MGNNEPVLYSFFLYLLYVLLPLVPAVLIFRMFPETKVTVSGPLQNLTLNATGAFAAYVVTVALGFFLVKDVVAEIESTRHYVVTGVITNLGNNQFIHSNQLCAQYTNAVLDPSGHVLSKEYDFVDVLDHPVKDSEKIWVQFTEVSDSTAPSGFGKPPSTGLPTPIPVELLHTNSFPQRFRLRIQDNHPIVEPETVATPAYTGSVQAVPHGVQ